MEIKHSTTQIFNDKKYVNKKERERHLPGYCQYISLEFVDYDESDEIL